MKGETRLSEQPADKSELSRKLDSVGWALFLIWVGIAFMADVGWGWGLLGVAAIVLGEAAARWSRQLRIGGFWVAVGLMFLAGGLWELLQIRWPLAPLLIIGCGVAVLWGVVHGKHLTEK
jgi:hypothetical protein